MFSEFKVSLQILGWPPSSLLREGVNRSSLLSLNRKSLFLRVKEGEGPFTSLCCCFQAVGGSLSLSPSVGMASQGPRLRHEPRHKQSMAVLVGLRFPAGLCHPEFVVWLLDQGAFATDYSMAAEGVAQWSSLQGEAVGSLGAGISAGRGQEEVAASCLCSCSQHRLVRAAQVCRAVSTHPGHLGALYGS